MWFLEQNLLILSRGISRFDCIVLIVSISKILAECDEYFNILFPSRYGIYQKFDGKVGAHVDPPTTYDKIKLKCLGTKYKEKLMYAMKVYYEDIKIILNIPRKI